MIQKVGMDKYLCTSLHSDPTYKYQRCTCKYKSPPGNHTRAMRPVVVTKWPCLIILLFINEQIKKDLYIRYYMLCIILQTLQMLPRVSPDDVTVRSVAVIFSS